MIKNQDDEELQLQEIENRFLRILEYDPEVGREKLVLFAARNGLREFLSSIITITSWSMKHAKDKDKSELLALSKIAEYYEIILKGAWSDKDIDKLTGNAADEKAQDDLPSSVDYLGRDRFVNALVP
ncbi:MAG: hypothetical protein methR_P0366 [Methyloprofundus sp.]|nr:MAG: hypothetical protein methR_P0366 [Methyloprofundus sp.]